MTQTCAPHGLAGPELEFELALLLCLNARDDRSTSGNASALQDPHGILFVAQ
ncbi:hypothetical protein [Ralstonia pickettii]|uniref:hypothetical protein n=1 Tax=Ralstonia pickettii TaxID=329 RepID=UPI000AE5A3D3|nr:hypothetical protein [Ralstonia pickettii]